MCCRKTCFHAFTLLFLLQTSATFVRATICPEFREFVEKAYGPATATQLAREDIAGEGSFGGCNHTAGARTSKNAVIFVHGLMGTAKWIRSSADFFVQNASYSWAELYGTTYGIGPEGVLNESMRCEHVKQMRTFIDAVHRFTGDQPVDIVAFSMGVPLIRKALAGGRCVDEHRSASIGASLARIVRNVVSVAGANYCAQYVCPLDAFPLVGDSPCNGLTGMVCGSEFLNDVNRHDERLLGEGERSLGVLGNVSVIATTADEIVGYFGCDECNTSVPTSGIPGAAFNITLSSEDIDHFLVYYLTPFIQLQLIEGRWQNETDPSTQLISSEHVPAKVRLVSFAIDDLLAGEGS